MKKPNLNCETCSGRKNSVFCDLHGAELTFLNNNKNSNLYKKGQNLFIEGNPPFGLFCVHSGKVKVTKTNSDGKETIVRIASSGDILGHRSLFSDSPYTASATLLEDGIVCFVGKQTIRDLIQKDPTLSFNIINKLSQQMGAAEERLASFARKSVRERFAEMLLLLKENYGTESNGTVRLDIKLTREEMASMVGAAPENIMRLMTDFKNDGLLEEDKKVITLTNVAAIEKEAALGLV